MFFIMISSSKKFFLPCSKISNPCVLYFACFVYTAKNKETINLWDWYSFLTQKVIQYAEYC